MLLPRAALKRKLKIFSLRLGQLPAVYCTRSHLLALLTKSLRQGMQRLHSALELLHSRVEPKGSGSLKDRILSAASEHENAESMLLLGRLSLLPIYDVKSVAART